MALEKLEIVRVVLGAGALGLALATDLRRHGGSLVVLSRRHLKMPLTLLWRESNPPVETWEPRVLTPSELPGSLPADLVIDRLEIFVCLPVKEVDATPQLLALLPWTFRKAVVFFCNNGLTRAALTNATREALEKRGTPQGVETCCLRALVFAGYQRDESHQGTWVRQAGGSLIRFGWPFGESSTSRTPFREETLASPSLTRSLHFTWRFEEGMRGLELSKFFVNLTLLCALGPRLQTNGSLNAVATAAEISALAEAFAAGCAEEGVTGRGLVAMLQETVAATAGNINSLSLAWHRGDDSIVKAFLSQFECLVSDPRSLEAAWVVLRKWAERHGHLYPQLRH